MQYSVGVEYCLHCLIYLVAQPLGESISVKELATFQGVSETYLSKAFTKLSKKGIIRSSTGVKGGYELAKDANDISFWDVIEAIEGNSYLFRCNGILRNTAILDIPKDRECPCLIKDIMHEAEDVMRDFLKAKSLHQLYLETNAIMTEQERNDLKNWFKKEKESKSLTNEKESRK